MVARFKNWIKQLRGTHGIVVSRDLDLKDERLELTQTAAGITSWEWNIVTDEMTWTAGRANLVRLGKEPRLRFQDVIANVHPSDRQPTLKAAHTAVATKTDYKCEFRVPTPAGSYRWILSRGKVFYDLTGNPLRMLGVNMDITDRKQLEESIVEEKERFRAIFEQTAIGVGYVLLKQPFYLANEKLCEMFGLTHEEMTRKLVLDLLHPDDRTTMAAIRDRMLEAEESNMVGEARFVRRDGTDFWGEISASRVRLKSDVPILVIFIQDITERIKAENVAKLAIAEMKTAMVAADAANLAKTSFVANMSHEIRTPLTAILGFSELLLEPTISETKRSKYVETIMRNGHALNQLINDILDLSKIEASHIDLVQRQVDLRSLVSHLHATALGLKASKPIDLDFQCHHSVPDVIHTDGDKLQQLLTNIVANAVKFTQAGSIKLTAALDRTDGTSGAMLSINVTDTGIGMTPDQQENLFQPFYQGDASLTRDYGGTGLGLMLARRLAQLFGGELTLVSSTFGKGSTFAVNVPVAIIDNFTSLAPDSELNTQKISDELRQRLTGVRILLVEDSADSREYLTSCLELGGIIVELACNGEEAIAKALAGEFAVIFMDIQMPEIDGIEATQRLRHLGYSMPIIALTAHALSGERERCLQAGCNAHVTKPIRPSELLNLVAGLV